MAENGSSDQEASSEGQTSHETAAGARKSILVTDVKSYEGRAFLDHLSASPDIENIGPIFILTDSGMGQAYIDRLLARPNWPRLDMMTITKVPGNAHEVLQSALQFNNNVPIYGIFWVADLFWCNSEEEYTKQLIQEAIRTNVRHFVLSSMQSGDEEQDIPDIRFLQLCMRLEKFLVDQISHRDRAVRTSASNRRLESASNGTTEESENPAPEPVMQYTILRPALILEMFKPNYYTKVLMRGLKSIPGNRKLQWISAFDVGVFAAQAMLNPQEFTGRSMSIAAFAMTVEEVRERIDSQTEEGLKPISKREFRERGHVLSQDILLIRWLWQQRYEVDIARCRTLNPNMMDLDHWLRSEMTEFELKR